MSYADFKEKIEYITKRYANKTSMVYMTEDGNDISFSFSDIYNIITETQSVLQKCGVVCGDRVAIITPHSPFGVMAGLALAYSNITTVMIDASLPIEEICRLLEFSDVRALFTTNDLYDKISHELTQNIPCFELGRDNTINKFISGSIEKVSMPETVDKDTDVIAIIFSSGTTNKMKGIMVTYHSVICARDIFADLAGLEDYMTYLLVLPFNHIAGFTGAMTYFLTGCELGFIQNVNSSKLAEGLQKFQPHYFAMIPKVYEIIEQKIRTQIHNKGKATEIIVYSLMKISGILRKYFGINIGRKVFKNIVSAVFGENIFGIGTGASPCKNSTTEFFLNLGLEWANLYATTETDVPIAATGIHDRYPVGTVGNVHRHKEIEIIINNPDSNGIGEVFVKTDLIMKGYFREPQWTKKAFQNEYFKTGDYGYIDKKGYLYLTGRIKESIVLKSGKKVSPTDVDNYYNSYLSKIILASCGIETNDRYDEIHMYVQNENYSEAAQKSIHDKLIAISNTAPQMYQLSEIHFIDKIPMTSVGKVKRFMLKSICSNTNHTTKNLSVDKNGIIDIFQKYCKDSVVTEQSNLKNDLGIDSLTMFEIICDIDEKFNVSIVDKLGSVSTVADLIKLTENTDNKNTHMQYNIKDYPIVKTNKDVQRLNLFGKLSKRLYNFEVKGIEHIPIDKNFILCPNHESHFDGMWVWTAISSVVDFNEICCLAKQEHLEHWITRIGLAMIGGIPVDRSGNPVPAMERALQCLNNEKYNMLIHPEGTRTRIGKLGEFKQGAAKLSIESGVRIIPVCIDGAYEIFPPKRRLPHLFDWKHFRKYPLKIQFGTPIEPKGKNAAEITEDIRRQIIEMKQERSEKGVISYDKISQ